MCLIVFAWQASPDSRLLLGANRDEFHDRPSAAASFWDDLPGVLAGRDLQAGGTWLGISRGGRFAAITNIRDPRAGDRPAPRSRGELTAEFLAGRDTPGDFLRQVAHRDGQYAGFNLLAGDGETLWYLHGAPGSRSAPRPLQPGVYALSNAALDVPWPKARLARRRLRALLEGRSEGRSGELPAHDALAHCVSDRETAEHGAPAGQGLDEEMARKLSAQFIVTPHYGTRCTTTLAWGSDGRREFREQRFDREGQCSGSAAFSLDGDR